MFVNKKYKKVNIFLHFISDTRKEKEGFHNEIYIKNIIDKIIKTRYRYQ